MSFIILFCACKFWFYFRFQNTTCELLLEDKTKAGSLSKLPKLKDDFYTVGGFDNFGIAEGTIGEEVGKVKKFRMSINSSSENWAILSEIFFKKVTWYEGFSFG